jgi:hypothetical protein
MATPPPDDIQYLDLVTKARVLVVHLAKNHPLPDGNKRAAYLASTGSPRSRQRSARAPAAARSRASFSSSHSRWSSAMISVGTLAAPYGRGGRGDGGLRPHRHPAGGGRGPAQQVGEEAGHGLPVVHRAQDHRGDPPGGEVGGDPAAQLGGQLGRPPSPLDPVEDHLAQGEQHVQAQDGPEGQGQGAGRSPTGWSR